MNPYDFSPGPWSVDFDPLNPENIRCDHVVDSQGMAICFMATKTDDVADEVEANAKAISAVPELIAACVKSLDFCYEQNSELGKEIIAALTKAGLRQPQIPLRNNLPRRSKVRKGQR